MPYNRHFVDYEPVTRRPRPLEAKDAAAGESDDSWQASSDFAGSNEREMDSTTTEPPAQSSTKSKPEHWTNRHGHTFSFIGLFLFTAVLYFRPYELFPALSGLTSIA